MVTFTSTNWTFWGLTRKPPGQSSFLLIAKLLYNDLCPSVRLSVRLSVCPSVRFRGKRGQASKVKMLKHINAIFSNLHFNFQSYFSYNFKQLRHLWMLSSLLLFLRETNRRLPSYWKCIFILYRNMFKCLFIG